MNSKRASGIFEKKKQACANETPSVAKVNSDTISPLHFLDTVIYHGFLSG
jgi:hypothetical protein